MENRLKDDEFRDYLINGFIVVEPSELEEDYHDFLYQKADGIYQLAGAAKSKTSHLDIIGDNLRAQIPSIDQLIEDPKVVGTLTSILGENYLLHPHNFVHRSAPADQGFHQDGNLPWNERGHYRSHRPDWALLFYYPQDVTLVNGPTEVLPGTQYWTIDCEKADGDWHRGDALDRSNNRDLLSGDDLIARDLRLTKEVQSLGVPNVERQFLTIPKGSVVICNYDIFHRGLRCVAGGPARYMFKFHFMRTQDPQQASWDNRAVDIDLSRVREDLKPIVSHLWNWSKANRTSETFERSEAEKLNDALLAGSENKKIEAVYRLSQMNDVAAADYLLRGLDHETESIRRAACHGLKASKNVEISGLIKMTQSQRAGTRRMAVYALGDSAHSTSKEVIDALIERLRLDADDLVRSNSAYALGQIARGSSKFSSDIIDALIERLAPGVETNNTEIASMPRSTVRQSIAYGIVQSAANHRFSGAQIEKLVEAGLDDDDRYVQGLTVEAVRLIGNIHQEALSQTLAVLSRARLSPTPI